MSFVGETVARTDEIAAQPPPHREADWPPLDIIHRRSAADLVGEVQAVGLKVALPVGRDAGSVPAGVLVIIARAVMFGGLVRVVSAGIDPVADLVIRNTKSVVALKFITPARRAIFRSDVGGLVVGKVIVDVINFIATVIVTVTNVGKWNALAAPAAELVFPARGTIFWSTLVIAVGTLKLSVTLIIVD